MDRLRFYKFGAFSSFLRLRLGLTSVSVRKVRASCLTERPHLLGTAHRGRGLYCAFFLSFFGEPASGSSGPDKCLLSRAGSSFAVVAFDELLSLGPFYCAPVTS